MTAATNTTTETDDASGDGSESPTAHGGSTASGESSTGGGPTVPARRSRWWHLSLPGLWVALVFICFSLTPSLLPRPGMVQGIVSGITAPIGYGFGVAGAMIWRECAARAARRPSRRAWLALAVGGGLLFVVSVVLGQIWQRQSRVLVEVEPESIGSMLVMIPVTLALFVVFVGLARGIRWVFRTVSSLLGRWIGARAAHALGWLLVAVLVVLLVTGALLDGIIAIADSIFSKVDQTTSDNARTPDNGLRSGGPGSLIPWDTLGFQGRDFAGLGPTTTELTAFNGASAKEPIRVYAGIRSAPDTGLGDVVTLEKRAELAVNDLARAGGFNRAYLLIAGTTGTGWVDPALVTSLEYETNGDVASVAMQYSYLPSWASIAVDRERAEEAGRTLFGAVYERWLTYPEGKRPKLLIAGESLGSDSIESAFNGEADLRTRISGGVLAGPPSFNWLHAQFTFGRDSGSEAFEPVYRNGRTVRFSDDTFTGIQPASQPWNGTRVLYLQHASDPVLWIDTDLLWQSADWLQSGTGHDVNSHMIWMPVISFWQVAGDMLQSVPTPPGHGHKYSAEYVDAWAAVLQPPNWTPQKTEKLHNIVLGH